MGERTGELEANAEKRDGKMSNDSRVFGRLSSVKYELINIQPTSTKADSGWSQKEKDNEESRRQNLSVSPPEVTSKGKQNRHVDGWSVGNHAAGNMMEGIRETPLMMNSCHGGVTEIMSFWICEQWESLLESLNPYRGVILYSKNKLSLCKFLLYSKSSIKFNWIILILFRLWIKNFKLFKKKRKKEELNKICCIL